MLYSARSQLTVELPIPFSELALSQMGLLDGGSAGPGLVC